MSVVIALGIGYLAVGAVLGAWSARLHQREQWQRLPELRGHGARHVVLVIVGVALISLTWPYAFVLVRRQLREEATS